MRPVPVLVLSAVAAIALPLAACGGDNTSAQATTTAIPAPSVPPVNTTKPTKADKTDIPGASASFKECLGDNGIFATVSTNERSTRLSLKDGETIASLFAYDTVADAEKFASQMRLEEPLQRGKVVGVLLRAANAKARKAVNVCFQKL